MRRRPFRELLLNIGTVVATLAAVGAAVIQFRERSRMLDGDRPRIVAEWRRYATDGTRLGAANPRVTIVEFADFQCPYCRSAASTLRELRRRYPEEIALVYRHYPLQDGSLDAAVAAECGNRAGFFEAIHDRLFEEADSLGSKPWTRIAWEAGILDTLQFAACMKDSSTLSAVTRDIRAASELGVNGTPTLLVNDQLFTGSPGLEYLERYVRQAVAAR